METPEGKLALIQEHISTLQQQLSKADRTIEAVTQDRDHFRRELADVTAQRDKALAAVSKPVYELLSDLAAVKTELDSMRKAKDQRILQLIAMSEEANKKANSLHDQNRQLRSDLELTRAELRGKEKLLQAPQRTEQSPLAVPVLFPAAQADERSPMERALEAASHAEACMQRSAPSQAAGWSQVAGAWTGVAGMTKILEQGNDTDRGQA